MKYWLDIEKEIKEKNLNVDMKLIREALLLAQESHIGQFRKSGEEYILHPVEVTRILIDMKMDTDTIIAGILHDVVEDTFITIADIEYNFGKNAAQLVDGVTKLKILPNGTKDQYENIRKMILAMSLNLSVVIIKLADRLHNMRTLKYMKPEKQMSISQETLEIYAPLAHRLGIAKIKWELEDLALSYLKPKEYQELKKMIDTKKGQREKYIDAAIEILKVKIIDESKLKVTIKGRIKHFYSIYKKIYEKGKEFEHVYDLMGIRIVAENKRDCYHILGIIQENFQPVPGRFKDYISAPKSNNYQSIHTTVIGAGGTFVEIQIRTEEMDKIAENGIAAHWSYKEQTSITKKDQVYGWLRGVIETQQEGSSEEFVKGFTEELIRGTVFVFSPKGDIVELTSGSTPLDFAFYIHSDIGCKCIGAKVNGKIVPLEYKLKNGDCVEVITSKNAKGPGNDWLNMVVTSGAKNKIRKWIKEQKFEENIKIGRDLLEDEIEKIGMTIKEFEENKIVKKHLEKHNIPSLDDLCFQIAEKRSKLDVIITKVKLELEIEKEKNDRLINPIPSKVKVKEKIDRKKNDYGVIVDGIENTLIKFAKCCTPLPGDEIGGYITKITGITIHRKECQNYLNMIKLDPGRQIDVRWDNKIEESRVNKYKFAFNVFINNRNNVLADIISLISNHKILLTSINSSILSNDEAKIKIIIEIRDKNDYSILVNNILKIKDVLSIER